MGLELKGVVPGRDRQDRGVGETDPVEKKNTKPRTKSTAKPRRPHAARASATAEHSPPIEPPADPMARETDPRVQVSVTAPPALWRRYSDLAAELSDAPRRVSVNALVTATLAFSMPADEAALELVQRWRLERQRDDDPYSGVLSAEKNVRIFDQQRRELDRLARVVRDRHGVSGARSLIVNAVLEYSGPTGLEEASELIRRFNLMLIGASQLPADADHEQTVAQAAQAPAVAA